MLRLSSVLPTRQTRSNPTRTLSITEDQMAEFREMLAEPVRSGVRELKRGLAPFVDPYGELADESGFAEFRNIARRRW